MLPGMPSTRKTKILTSFGDASAALAYYLWEKETLDVDDREFIENHLLIVQLAYTAWRHTEQKKRPKKTGPPIPYKTAI
jgi:hypothetical protein